MMTIMFVLAIAKIHASLMYRIYTKNIEGSLNDIVNLVYELILPDLDKTSYYTASMK